MDATEVENGSLPSIGAATETIGGTKVPVVKLGLGADGVRVTDALAGQQTMANSMAVVLASDHGAIPVTPSANTTARTFSPPTFVAVGTSSGTAVSANPSRVGLTLVNTSANNISLAFGTTAVLNRGITLLPGGVFEMDERTFTTGAINAVASAASSNLAIQEVT